MVWLSWLLPWLLLPLTSGAHNAPISIPFMAMKRDSERYKADYRLSPGLACSSKGSSLCSIPSSSAQSAALLLATSPQTFDLRNRTQTGGVRVLGGVRDQGDCNTCVSFSVGAAAETAVAVALQKDATTWFSTGYFYFCTSGGEERSCQTEWTLTGALQTLVQEASTGTLVTEQCFPYTTTTTSHTCSDAPCKDVYPDLATGEFHYSQLYDVIEMQQWIRDHGPVLTPLAVHDDFKPFFKAKPRGVYTCESETPSLFRTAVLLVGYNNDDMSWVARQTWGSGFADNGYFKIAYEKCEVASPANTYGVRFALKLPVVLATPLLFAQPSSPSCYNYKGRRGDYISKVAGLCGVSIQSIMLDNINQIKSLDMELEGVSLRLCSITSESLLKMKASGFVAQEKCAPIDGYTFVPGKAVKRRRLYKAMEGQSILQMADECRRDTPGCAAIDTGGWFRFNVTLQMESEAWESLDVSVDGCPGTYVLQDATDLAFLSGGFSIGEGTGSGLQASLQTAQLRDQYKMLVAKNLTRIIQKAYGKVKKAALLAPYPGGGIGNDELLMLAALPSKYDTRNQSDTGGRTIFQPARAQGACGACVAFAMARAAETAVVVARGGTKDADVVSFSEHAFFFCSHQAVQNTCSSGWTLDRAAEEIKRYGMVLNRCRPYKPPSMLSSQQRLCEMNCSDTERYAGSQFAIVPIENYAQAKRAIVLYGGVVTAMLLYPDVFGMKHTPYATYARSADIPESMYVTGHAVFVVGFNDEEGCWYVQTSWGPDWPAAGTLGVFKVAYGEAGIMSAGYTYALTWSGLGAQPRRLQPLTPDLKNTPRCRWYNAKAGDTLVGVWLAATETVNPDLSLSQLLDDNADNAGANANNILQPPLAGKLVRICNIK